MPIDRFFIAPYDKESGLTKNFSPFMIPDTAFAELTNAYVFRGRVRKRFGSRWNGNTQLESRFRINIGTTNGFGTVVCYVPHTIVLGNRFPIATPAIGQMFSVGTEVFTVNTLGNPATLLKSGTSTSATFVTTSGTPLSGEVVIVGADPNTKVYYYPALPVMGLRTFESAAINAEQLIGFDQKFAYEYNNGWERLATGDAYWNGASYQFFNSCTWLGAGGAAKIFFATNFNETEPLGMRTYDGTTWSTFKPTIDASANKLVSAKIIIPFKNRLVALNTWEGGVSPTNYPNRARYSQIGSPLDADAWREDIPGRGNAVDCSTTEAIVAAEFVKDHLIVYFERSTWDLAYTGNVAYPFVWQQINNELGVESTFSVVPFDKIAIGVGNVGIHACNGANTERIDAKIPDEVFNIHNKEEGVFRVYGIRDYEVEMVYWTFPDDTRTATFPYSNKVLVFNYKNNTWAFNDDSITCFGYYFPTSGITWSSTVVKWDSTEKWNSGNMGALTQSVIAGNQQGYTFAIDPEETTNAAVIQITYIAIAAGIATITSINHNFKDDDYIYIQDVVGTLTITDMNDTIYNVIDVVDENTFTIATSATGVYKGNGTISRVSNVQIKTKEYNFYADQGRNAYISKVDFLVETTAAGKINVDYFLSTSGAPSISTTDPTVELGDNILETSPYQTIELERTGNMTRLWHPMYFDADGECIQLYFHLSNDLMVDTSVRESDFVLHGMCFYVQPTSRLQ